MCFEIFRAVSICTSLSCSFGLYTMHRVRLRECPVTSVSTAFLPVLDACFVHLTENMQLHRRMLIYTTFVTGEYAAAFVRGFQESPVDPSHLQASACCKHYDANSMEGSTEAGVHHTRHDFNANVTLQDLVDSYMPGFQACVEKGRVSGVSIFRLCYGCTVVCWRAHSCGLSPRVALSS